uniref:Secreted protein n=1 Tax=Anguilla anguilla TaxID=7936 RepID=A0A0E9Q3M8_ANGAN
MCDILCCVYLFFSTIPSLVKPMPVSQNNFSMSLFWQRRQRGQNRHSLTCFLPPEIGIQDPPNKISFLNSMFHHQS